MFMGFNPWYYQTLRRTTQTFGTIFKDLVCVKYDANTRAELKRTTVPIQYAGKEAWAAKVYGDPTAQKGIQVDLPQMSFEMTTLKYDAERATTQFAKQTLCAANNSTITTFPRGVPWDIGINLYIYVRNQEDGTQLIEQILPFFSPAYTMSVKYLWCAGDPDCFVSEDLPFVLENVDYNNNYEGPAGTVRMIVWTLQFNAKIWLYGPMSYTGLINTAFANIHTEPANNISAAITVTPNPPTANITDDYGFTTVIDES